jgi:hypothetical protein
MVFNATFQLHRGGQFYWRRKPEYNRPAASHAELQSAYVLAKGGRMLAYLR